MAIKAELGLDPKNFNKGLDDSVKTANQKLSEIGKGQTGGDKKGVAGMMEKGMKAGQNSFSRMVGDFGDLTTGAAAVAAVTAVVGLGVAIYDKYRESVLEAAEAEREKSKSAIEDLNALKKSNDARAATAQKLADLGTQEKLSEVQKIEAKKAIDSLGESYKRYGVAIDETTGKLLNAGKAQAAMLEEDKQKEMAKIKSTLKQLEADKRAQEAVINGAGVPTGFGYRLGGKDEAKAAGKSIEEIGKQASDLRTRLAELKRATPGQDAINLTNAREADKIIKVVDGLTDKNDELADSIKLTKQEAEVNKILNQLKKDGVEVDEYSKQVIIDKVKKQQELNSDKYYKDQLKALDEQVAIENLKLKNLDEESEKQKIINDLKKQGLKVDEAEVEKMMKKKRELASIAVANDLKKEFEKLGDDVNEKFGDKKKARLEKAMRDYEEKKGSKLTDDEIAKIKKLSELQDKVNDVPKLSFGDTEIKTNDLTRRGGASTLAVVSNADKINQQIANYSKMQVDLLKQVKDEIVKANNY